MRDTTILIGAHGSDMVATQHTRVIRLFATIQNERDPTQRPKDKEQDHGCRPRQPGRKGANPCSCWFLLAMRTPSHHHWRSREGCCCCWTSYQVCGGRGGWCSLLYLWWWWRWRLLLLKSRRRSRSRCWSQRSRGMISAWSIVIVGWIGRWNSDNDSYWEIIFEIVIIVWIAVGLLGIIIISHEMDRTDGSVKESKHKSNKMQRESQVLLVVLLVLGKPAHLFYQILGNPYWTSQ